MSKGKDLGTALENRVVTRARKLGLTAHRQPGSGIFSAYPNDAVIGRLLVECKVRSRHPSLSEMLEWLYLAQANVAKHRAEFDDAIVIYNTKGERMPKVLIELDTFLSLLAQNREESLDIRERRCDNVSGG